MTTMAATWRASASRPRYPDHRPIIGDSGALYGMCVALAASVAMAAGLTVAFPSLLGGVAVSNGNLRGTAVALLAVGLPVLLVAMVGTARGSARAVVVWLGALGYLIYQAVLLCFATPMNNLFLFYVAYLGLAVWSTVLLLRATDLDAFAARLSAGAPARVTAGAAAVLVVLNAGAWLSQIVPAVLSSRPTSVLDGTGLVINPIYVQDLAVWLPLLAVAAVACWRRQAWGLLVTAAMLTLFVLESISIWRRSMVRLARRSDLVGVFDVDGAGLRCRRSCHSRISGLVPALGRPGLITQSLVRANLLGENHDRSP